jgi:hypothetical protein
MKTLCQREDTYNFCPRMPEPTGTSEGEPLYLSDKVTPGSEMTRLLSLMGRSWETLLWTDGRGKKLGSRHPVIRFWWPEKGRKELGGWLKMSREEKNLKSTWRCMADPQNRLEGGGEKVTAEPRMTGAPCLGKGWMAVFSLPRQHG